MDGFWNLFFRTMFGRDVFSSHLQIKMRRRLCADGAGFS